MNHQTPTNEDCRLTMAKVLGSNWNRLPAQADLLSPGLGIRVLALVLVLAGEIIFLLGFT